MTVFFTSDHHLGHRAMAWMRGYGEWPTDRNLITPELVAEHDALLAERWDAVVRKDDTVWVLGDLVGHSQHVPRALDWIKARPGRKHFIVGNHDPAHPMHKDAHLWQRKYLDAFESVQMAAKRTIPLAEGGHQLVLLSHFPYTGDGIGREDRCSQWRLPNQGYVVLHGHTHAKEKVTEAMGHSPGDWPTKQIHVGVDAHDFCPVSLEEVAALLGEAQAQ